MNSQQLQDCFNNCILNESSLWENFYSFYENVDKDNVVNILVDSVKKTLKDSKIKAVQKYYALQLLKQCMGSKSKKLVEYTAKNLMATLTEISKHNIGSSDPKRGQNVFGAGQDKEASNDFFFLLLESIKAWSLIFPNIPEFKKAYASLTKEGVVFPKEMVNYQQELQDLGATPANASSSSLNTPQPQPPQQIDQATEQQVSKLSKFLSNIDENLKILDNADPSSLDLETFGQCIGPLEKQLNKISQALIMQVLTLPQNPTTEFLQKKLFEVKELLETIPKEYKRAAEKPKLYPQIISSLRSQISIYLQNNAGGSNQTFTKQQTPAPPLQNKQQPQQQMYDFGAGQSGKKNQNFNDFNQFQQGQPDHSGFNDFQFGNFNTQKQQQQPQGFDTNKDVFTEFQTQNKPPQNQFGGFEQQQNLNMQHFGFEEQKQNVGIHSQQQLSAQNFGFEEQKQNPFDSGQGGEANPFDSQSGKSQRGNPFDNNSRQDTQQGFDQANPFDSQIHKQPGLQQQAFQQGSVTGFGDNPFGAADNPFGATDNPDVNHIDFFQSQGGVNNPQVQQAQQGELGNPFNDTHSQNNVEITHTQSQQGNQEMWGGANDYHYDNQNVNPFDSGRDQHNQQPQSGHAVDNVETRNKAPSYASQVRGGYDVQDIHHTQQSQGQNENYAWNQDHQEYGGQASYGHHDQYAAGGETNKHDNNYAGGYGDVNQSYNHGTNNQNQYGNDYDQYGYQNNYGQSNNDGRRQSVTDFNQNVNNSVNNGSRKDSIKDSIYNAGLSDSQYNIVMKKNDSMYAAWKKERDLFDNPVIVDNQTNNSVWKTLDYPTYDPNMVYDPNPTQPNVDVHQQSHDQQNHSLTDINKNQPVNTSINAVNNQPLHFEDLTGPDHQNSSYNHQNNLDQHSQQAQQQGYDYNNNWGMGADTASVSGNDPNKRKDSTNFQKDQFNNYKYDDHQSQHHQNGNQYDEHGNQQDNHAQYDAHANQYDPHSNQYDPHSNQYDPHANQFDPHANQYDAHTNQFKPHDDQFNQYNQNKGWGDNVDFFGDQTNATKPPSNTNNDFFGGGDFYGGGNSAAHEEEQKQNMSGSVQPKQTNVNNSISHHNEGWTATNFDQNDQQSIHNQNFNQNSNNIKADFNDGFGFDQNKVKSETNTNANDFFPNDFGAPAQTQPSKQVDNNNFGGFDVPNQSHTIPEQKEWFQDMKQPQVNDDFFNVPSTQINQNSFQNPQVPTNTADAANIKTAQVDIFNDFATPVQPTYQQPKVNNDHGFDFGGDQTHQISQSQNQYQQPQWNQPPDQQFQGFYDNQHQNEYQQNKPVNNNQVDIFDMYDQAGAGANKNQNQQSINNQPFVQQPNQNQQQNSQDIYGMKQSFTQQSSQQRPLAQPEGKKTGQVGQVLQPYQFGQKVVRDSIQQTTNEYDRSSIGLKTYKIVEVSPEIRKRNEEFYQQLSKEEAIKGYMEDQRKEFLKQKINETDPERSQIISKKLEILNTFQLLIIERQDTVDPQFLSVPKNGKQLKSKLVQSIQTLLDAEQKDVVIKEIKELNDHILKLQNEIERRIGDEQITLKRIDDLEKELFNTKRNSETIRKELEGILQEHDKILSSEKETRIQNDSLLKEIEILNQELNKLKNDQSKILNEVIDPEYFKKSFISQLYQQQQQSPSAGPNLIESGIDNDYESKKILNNVRQRFDEYHSVQVSRSMREGYKIVEEKVQSSMQLEMTNKVRNNLDKLLELNYQSSPHKEDALVKMIGAKSVRQRLKDQNKIFFNTQIYRDLLDLPIYQNERENLDNFKYACLNQKAILYENNSLQIGVVSNLQQASNLSDSLILTLHFINKTQDQIQFSFTFSTNYSKFLFQYILSTFFFEYNLQLF